MPYKDKEKAKAYERAYRQSHPEKLKNYYQEHRERIVAYSKSQYQIYRDRVLDHYGRECSCCGEAELTFLTIDHVNNDGAKHRREIGHGANRLYQWLIKNDFPEGFQTLCRNCNWAKTLGVCPHEKNKLGS